MEIAARIIMAIGLVGFFPLFGLWIVSDGTPRERLATRLFYSWLTLIGAALILNWAIN